MKGSFVLLSLMSLVSMATAADYLSQSWEFSTGEVNNNVFVLNLNDDPLLEIVADAYRSGLVFAIDVYGEQIWRHGVQGIVFDTYALESVDRKNEVVIGTWNRGVSVNGDGEANWKKFVTGKDAASVYLNDLDGDGRNEVIIGIVGGWRGNSITISDDNGEITETLGLSQTSYPNVFYAGDIDNDNFKEILVGLASYSANTIAKSYEVGFKKEASVKSYDKDGGLMWTFPTAGGVSAITSDDIDGDGLREILVGAYKTIYALRPDGSLKWSVPTAENVKGVISFDINNDGAREIIAGSDKLYVMDGNGTVVWKSGNLGEVNAIDVADFDFDGKFEILAGTTKLSVFSSSGETLWTSESFKEISGIRAADVDMDGYLEVVVGSKDSRVRLFASREYIRGKIAREAYEDATLLYDDGDYDNASLLAEKSKKFYSELGDLKWIYNAEELVNKSRGHQVADNYSALATERYEAKDYENASQYASKAVEIYQRINDVKALKRMSEMFDASAIRPLADANLSIALRLYSERNFENASEYAKNAYRGFILLGDGESENSTGVLVSSIGKQVEADRNLKEAEYFYGEKAYDEAFEYLNIADEIYTNLSDDGGKQIVQDFRNRIIRARGLETGLLYGGIGFGIFFVIGLMLIVLVVAIVLMRQRDMSIKVGKKRRVRRKSLTDI